MSVPLIGTVDNGGMKELRSSFYNGPVGFRDSDSGCEISYASSRVPLDNPISGTLDGRAFTAAAVRKSAISTGMIVMAIRWTGDAG